MEDDETAMRLDEISDSDGPSDDDSSVSGLTQSKLLIGSAALSDMQVPNQNAPALSVKNIELGNFPQSPEKDKSAGTSDMVPFDGGEELQLDDSLVDYERLAPILLDE